MLRAGMSAEQCAKALGVSTRTVERTIKREGLTTPPPRLTGYRPRPAAPPTDLGPTSSAVTTTVVLPAPHVIEPAELPEVSEEATPDELRRRARATLAAACALVYVEPSAAVAAAAKILALYPEPPPPPERVERAALLERVRVAAASAVVPASVTSGTERPGDLVIVK